MASHGAPLILSLSAQALGRETALRQQCCSLVQMCRHVRQCLQPEKPRFAHTQKVRLPKPGCHICRCYNYEFSAGTSHECTSRRLSVDLGLVQGEGLDRSPPHHLRSRRRAAAAAARVCDRHVPFYQFQTDSRLCSRLSSPSPCSSHYAASGADCGVLHAVFAISLRLEHPGAGLDLYGKQLTACGTTPQIEFFLRVCNHSVI